MVTAVAAESGSQLTMLPADAFGIARPGPDVLSLLESFLGVIDELCSSNESEELTRRRQLVEKWDPLHAFFASTKAKDRKESYRRAILLMVTEFYRRALYGEVQLPVHVKGNTFQVDFVRGHPWGDDTACGPTHRDIMLIGKHPGPDEVQQRLNFIGPTGETLYETLKRVGFQEPCDGSMYVTNLVRHLNPERNASKMPAGIVKNCLPILQIEARVVQPKVMFLMGVEAISAVLGKDVSYKEAAGQVFEVDLTIDTRPQPVKWPKLSVAERNEWLTGSIPHKSLAIASVHPASLFHNPANKLDLDASCGLLRQVVANDYQPLSSTGYNPESDKQHTVITDVGDLFAWAKEVRESGAFEFALDTEFDGNWPADRDSYLCSIQASWGWKKAVSLELNSEDKSAKVLPADAVRKVLTDLMYGPDKRIIFAYAAADLPWLTHFGLGFLEDQFEVPPDDDPFVVPPERWLPGWVKTIYEGGFDVVLAMHAIEEVQDFDLKSLGVKYTTCGRYDRALLDFLRAYCKQNKIKRKSITGFGCVPTAIRGPYGCYDADVTWRLYSIANHKRDGNPPLLDRDRFGLCSRLPFWRAMRAAPAFLEMHCEGITLDKTRAEEQRVVFATKLDEMLKKFRKEIHWPTFNHRSHYDKRVFLFGPDFARKFNARGQDTYELPDLSDHPEYDGHQPHTLNIIPYKSTGKKPKMWSEIMERNAERFNTPSTDKESLTVLGVDQPLVWDLRSISFLNHAVQNLLKPPRMVDGKIVDDEGTETDDPEDFEYDEGLLRFMCDDNRIRTNYSQTKETGRSSSWKPPTQNFSKRREEQYAAILKDRYIGPLRGMVIPEDGYVLVEADYIAAELVFMAIQSGDAKMLEYVRRMNLKADDPNHLCIHSLVAIKAFQLVMPDGSPVHPSKRGIKDLFKATGKWEKARDAAKPVSFGKAYGMSAEAARRKAKEEGVDLTMEEAQNLFDSLDDLFPGLPLYFSACGQSVEDNLRLVSAHGRMRRFWETKDEKTMAAMKREAGNFPIQGGIADHMNTAADHLKHHRRKKELGYKMALQIHDAFLFKVPYSAVETMIEQVIPECMRDRVAVYRRALDGTLLDPTPHHLEVETSVFLRWGEPIKKADCERLGIPAKYGQ